MNAIILAAGVGRRLGLSGPKCLLDVGGLSIIHRQVAAFRAAGATDVVVVVGHARDEVRRHLAGQPGRFTFIVNERFAETNTIYSLYLARDYLRDAFLYANGDVVFDRRLVERLAAAGTSRPVSALAVNTAACGEEEVKVIVKGDRIVRIGKRLDPAHCRGEFVGVARFSGEIAPAFVEALVSLVEAEGIVTDYFERAVDRLCEDWILAPVDVSDLPCREIDFPEDLAAAREHIARRLVG